jgi:predicted ArsR family transcriptional regulator
MKPIRLTPKTARVLEFLQENDGQYFGDEIAAAVDLNPRGIHGVLNSLFKNGLVDKAEAERTISVDGEDVVRAYKVYSLTEAGEDFDLSSATISE